MVGIFYMVLICLNTKATGSNDYKLAHTLYVLCLVKILIEIILPLIGVILESYGIGRRLYRNLSEQSYANEPDQASSCSFMCGDGWVAFFVILGLCFGIPALMIFIFDFIYFPYMQFQQYLFLKYYKEENNLNEGIQMQINNNGIGVNDSGNQENVPAGAFVREEDFNV